MNACLAEKRIGQKSSWRPEDRPKSRKTKENICVAAGVLFILTANRQETASIECVTTEGVYSLSPLASPQLF
jgi:hypothetical protein